jgi:hypothetical protein
MKLKLTKSEFARVPQESVYNNNVYLHMGSLIKIKEICHEDENFYEYRLVSGDVLLGCSYEPAFGRWAEDWTEIDFGVYFT